MLTLYYGPGACSMASHIVLEESGEKYEPRRMDLAKGEQRTPEYLKMNPQGREPLLQLDNGEPLAENTAILPYLGKRFTLWPADPTAEAKALSTIGFFAASVHPAHAHVGRPERYTEDQSAFPGIKAQGLKTFHSHLKQIDGMLAGREWFGDSYSVLDPYGLSSPPEFFAVAVEAFFQDPVAVATGHRELYAFLTSYFNQDPARWVTGQA